ncbi:MAG: cyclopropane-fatty-acyl-phospholipid synthase family protein [Candidatus Binatia bacterium]|nr:cyclopropane-fatty-acyl-phospholipid synthase family protein [Candidatus Binatia bacterium]
MATLVRLAERGYLPDAVVRRGIRLMLLQRLREQARLESSSDDDDPRAGFDEFVRALQASPIALCPEKANEQHYELPPEFFVHVLGPRLKYSCCYWPRGVRSLAEAEEAMLQLTAQRAGLRDGQRVLDLGCGWGSFTLWAAERYPKSVFHAVSNSAAQRTFIEARARERGLKNVHPLTADVNDFDPDTTFDRVVSIEMFEHLRNYPRILARIAKWLRPHGELFVHIFVHRQYAYSYSTDGATNWMGRYFFTGGSMPSDDLLPRFQRDLVLTDHWRLRGVHYQRTAEAWRERLEQSRAEILGIFSRTYGAHSAVLWYNRWRLFFLACEEMFGFRQGREWWVSHYRFDRRQAIGVASVQGRMPAVA